MDSLLDNSGMIQAERAQGAAAFEWDSASGLGQGPLVISGGQNSSMVAEPDALLWAAAGSRCAICAGMVGQSESTFRGTPVRIVTGTGSAGLALPPGFLVGVENHILLCAMDAAMVESNRSMYPPQELRRLKAIQTSRAAQRSVLVDEDDAPDRATLLVHTAYFRDRPGDAQFFLKLTNEAAVRDLRVDRIWFDLSDVGGGLREVINRDRPLPARVAAGDLFETWIPAATLSGVADPWTRARALLGDGSVAESRFNRDVPKAGVVGGGGTPLRELAENVSHLSLQDGAVSKSWDVFISHAGEDKAELVRPLARALDVLKIKVWYDEFEMSIGDSLNESIDRGIANSAFGVVILSPSFLGRKPWTSYELRGLVQGWVFKRQVILPIWHKVTREEVAAFSPTLGDTVAFDSSRMTVDQMADGIGRVVMRAKTKAATSI